MWEKLDKILKSTSKEINSSFEDLKEDIIDLTYTLDLDFDEINNLGARQKRLISKVKKIPSFYTKNIKTNRDILFVLLLGLYLTQAEKLYDISLDVFEKASNDAIDRLPFKTKYVDFLPFLYVLGLSYEDYLKNLALVDAQETTNNILNATQTNANIDIDKLIEKQRKRILNINDDKHSGVLHDTAIKVENNSYLEPLKNKNHHVRFCAIEDERTTPMCHSMDGMIFNTVDKNSFDRETSNGLQHYEINGLVEGINLPPITSFVHHCRSWIEFID